jgi:cell division control protein 7
MILLFFLAGKFPLFQSGDDVEGLMEIATIIGRKKMEKTATLHSTYLGIFPPFIRSFVRLHLFTYIYFSFAGRTFATNVPSISQDGMPWREFVQKQNEELMEPRTPNPRFYPYNTIPSQLETNSHLPPPSSSSSGHDRSSPSASPSTLAPSTPESHAQDIDSAFDLLEGLMHPESTRRMTPRDALYHPFLADPSEPEDDEFFPHPFGEGVCGDWHHLDEVTEEACVRVNVGVNGEGGGEVRRVMAGEGIAIGRWPCEFHRREYACEE